MVNYRKQYIYIICFLLICGFLITSLASYYVSRSSLRSKIETSELPLVSDNIYSEIQRDLFRPITISSLMASDTFLRDWVLSGEKDETEIRKYLKEIHEKHDTFTSFFVSEKTRIYYHFNAILKKISSEEKRDKWYFIVREKTNDYDINIDPDMANKDAVTIFVNHKVFDYDGNFIGATGVGLTVNAVNKLIYKYKQKYNRNIYLTDKFGNIFISSEVGNEGRENINNVEGISFVTDKILSSEASSFKFERNGKMVHLNSRFVPGLEAYLLVEQTEEGVTGQIFRALVINIIICVIVTILVIVLINFILNAYRRKLARLAEDDEKLRKINYSQEIEIYKQNQELLKKNHDLHNALAEVKQLNGFLPICASCKKIRDDKGYWNQIETYIQAHSEAEFSHSICPECAKKLYSEFHNENDK